MTPEIVAHLWQSTLFAVAAWLVALALRTNRAQVRYWVWFIASAKFLIPFSLLVGLGALMPHPAAAPPVRTEWVAAFQELSQPLALPMTAAQIPVAAGAANHGYLTTAALALWACGFAMITICWLLRWSRVHTLRRSAHAVSVPAGMEISVPVMSIPDLIEPGVFGILRPVLLLPEGIAERLNQTQLDAILAHEFCHIRRRDNLTATIHMAVQAIFWFHPLTWWIGARLVDERERACDEEVLRLGCKPNVYAESILMICKLYLSSPLACVSGVTGSDLRKRIESIMRNRGALGLNLGKKLALGAAGVAALAMPVVIGALNAAAVRAQDAADWQTKAGGKMAFEVASVKLDPGPFRPPNFPLSPDDAYQPVGGRFSADFQLFTYITFAYKIWPSPDQRQSMMAQLPSWAATDNIAIDARAAGNPTKDQMRLMMQSLLAERFKLAVHFETKEGPVFAMVLTKPGKTGPKLRPHSEGVPCEDTPATNGPPARDSEVFPPVCDTYMMTVNRSSLTRLGSRNTTLDILAGAIPGPGKLDHPVVDRTGLTGKFDFSIEFASEPNQPSPPNADTSADLPGPTFLDALREQLGLKLEPARVPLRVLVIDKVERPSEN
jgi:bla regulator protein blaR1